MKQLSFIVLSLCLWSLASNATVVYSDGENGTIEGWSIVEGSAEEASIDNVYNLALGSRVIHLAAGGSYDLRLPNQESWNNRTDRFLSFRMNYTNAYTIYVSVDTTDGHRWLFFNNLNGHWGYHGTGILSAFGNTQSHNGTWQTVTLDLDQLLKDTEPNLDITRVNGMRFNGWGGLIDNVTLYTPEKTVYENGENNTTRWHIADSEPAGATVSVVHDEEEMLYRGEVNGLHRTAPFMYAYNDNAIHLQENGADDNFTIGAISGDAAWNNTTQTVLQWKMRNTKLCTVTVYLSTQKGNKRLVYTPIQANNGMSENKETIHHALGVTRNGDGVGATTHTGGRWITYTRDLRDDLRDYDPTNQLLSVNGMTIQGTTFVDDIQLFSGVAENYLYPEPERNTVYEDAQDGTINGWSVRSGSIEGIVNIYDEGSNSRVIQLNGGGSYMLGDFDGANAWNHTKDTTIAWRMRTVNPYTVYVLVQTALGNRLLFYTYSPNRGLLHGFENGIHHGLGVATVDGRWRTITRDLERDLKDAEPENRILAVNGFIYNGGEGGMVDDIILYTPDTHLYESGESGTEGWLVSDNDPSGATVANIPDQDRQNRTLQGNVISLQGNGAENAYLLGAKEQEGGWNDQEHKLLQWRFRNFGSELEVLSAEPDARGTVRDPEAFAFRVYVQTAEGDRALVYTLGAEHQGIIENGAAIHHGLGDDRIRGSVWDGDNPPNEMGLWQTVTRDLEEDIRDFEPNNRLVAINGFEVRNSGLVDDIKSVDNALVYENASENPVTIYEDAEDQNTEGWSLFSNVSGVATVRNVYDEIKQSRVIYLEGTAGKGDGFILGARSREGAWGEQTKKILQWSMKYTQDFTVYIVLETQNGRRYVTYAPRDEDRGLNGEYLQFGLGANADNGTWQIFTRNIAADLAQFEPGNALISINAFMIRGSGYVDDIQLLAHNVPPVEIEPTTRIYEDAEEGNTDGWSIFSNSSGTATISNVMDEVRGNRVIVVQGNGKGDGYMLGDRNGATSWRNRDHHQIRWSMNFSEDFTLYIAVETTNGRRYFTYTPREDHRGLNGQYLLLGLGADADNGTWQTFTHDLAEELQQFEPDNQLQEINAVMIRGSGRIDNIETF